MQLLMEEWRLLRFESPENPNLNLAVEEALLKSLSEKGVKTLRFWRNSKAVVIGRFQCPLLEVNFEECVNKGVKVVRRHTGGGAVYHDMGNLNFTLVFTKPLRELPDIFREVGEAVAEGLRALGLKSSFKPMNDVAVGQRKVAGLAGYVGKGVVLVHGCLLVSTDIDMLSRVLSVSREKLRDKFVTSVRSRVTTVSEELGRDTSTREVEEMLLEAFKHALSFEVYEEDLSREELAYAESLYQEKYSKAEWLGWLCKKCPLRNEHWSMIERLLRV